MQIELEINGSVELIDAVEGEDLAAALRRNGHTEVKCGCDGGSCGASTVLVDGDPEMACGMTAADAEGESIETVAALGTQSDLHPVQEAFVDHFAVQCGFCIPGMVLSATALLEENPDPTEEDIRAAIDDNVCRCTGYQKPVEAIQDAAGRMDTLAADGGVPGGADE